MSHILRENTERRRALCHKVDATVLKGDQRQRSPLSACSALLTSDTNSARQGQGRRDDYPGHDRATKAHGLGRLRPL